MTVTLLTLTVPLALSIISGSVAMTTKVEPQQQLRLHVYDHCPFCIRVELALGWNGQPYERMVYGYGDKLGDDSKEGCYDGGVVLTGKKELPVLEKLGSNGEREWLKAESLDIIDWVQQQPGCDPFPVKSEREDLKAFFRTDGRFKVAQRIISRPRALQMTNLKDWSREEDRAYAKTKYEKGGFDYAAAESADKEHLLEMNTLLEEANSLLGSGESFYKDGVLGFDDLLYLPELRTVTLAKGVNWPEKLRNYIISAHSKANVATYFENQIA